MPTRALHACAKAGCRSLNVAGSPFCSAHQSEAQARQRAIDAARPTARERGYNTRWDKARKTYLARHPICVRCEAEQRTTPATVVDHREPHGGDQRKFWDTANWQALCATCHNRKTATEDSGFARRRPLAR